MNGFDAIESTFQAVRKSQNSTNLQALSNAITSEFKKTINCRIVDEDLPVSRFVMSTTPDTTTLDKVLAYAADSSSKIDAIVGIWKGATKWELEINKAILKLLNAQELTAITCHELWHVIYSDRVIRRLQDSLSFAINSSRTSVKDIITIPRFHKILRIPGLVSCQLLFNKNEMISDVAQHKKYLNQEINADAFSAKKGYRLYLINAITKLEAEIKREGTNQIQMATVFSAGILEDLTTRKEALAKHKLASMMQVVNGEILTEAVEDVYNDWFTDCSEAFLESYMEKVDTQVFEELGLFTKALAPIEQNQIDYAYVKAENMKTPNDKMMVLSYVNSKIELAEYYLAILDDPKLAKKYRVPHTKNELLRLKNKLEAVREKALSTDVTQTKNIVVYYPDGYLG